MPLSACSASSASTRVVVPSLDSRAMNCGRGPTRPGLAKSRIAQRSPSPFSIGVPVSAMRLRAGIRRSCCDVSLAGFLIACASSSTTRAHDTAGERFDVANRGAVRGDDDVGVGDLGRDLVGARRAARRGARRSRRPGVKRAASAVQLPTTAGGAITSAGPGTGAGEQVRQHRRRLAEAHVEREATAEAGLVEEAEPRQRFRLVAAQLADEAVGNAGRRRRDVGRGREQVGGPTAADDVDAAAQRRTFDAEREAQHRRARQLAWCWPARPAPRPRPRDRRGRSRPTARRSG